MGLAVTVWNWCLDFGLLQRQPWHGGRDWRSLYLIKFLLQILPVFVIDFNVTLNHGKLRAHLMFYVWPLSVLLNPDSNVEISFRGRSLYRLERKGGRGYGYWEQNGLLGKKIWWPKPRTSPAKPPK